MRRWAVNAVAPTRLEDSIVGKAAELPLRKENNPILSSAVQSFHGRVKSCEPECSTSFIQVCASWISLPDFECLNIQKLENKYFPKSGKFYIGDAPRWPTNRRNQDTARTQNAGEKHPQDCMRLVLPLEWARLYVTIWLRCTCSTMIFMKVILKTALSSRQSKREQ